MLDPEIFCKLHQWLEDDRDRRSLVLRADNCAIWHAALYIEHKCIGAASGCDINETLTEVLDGMVFLPEPEGIRVKFPQKRIAVWTEPQSVETEIEVPTFLTETHISELAERAAHSMLQVKWKEKANGTSKN